MQNGQKLFNQLPTVFPNDVEMQKFVKDIGQWVTNLNAHAMPQPQQPVAPPPTQQQSTPPPIPTTQTPPPTQQQSTPPPIPPTQTPRTRKTVPQIGWN